MKFIHNVGLETAIITLIPNPPSQILIKYLSTPLYLPSEGSGWEEEVKVEKELRGRKRNRKRNSSMNEI